jgi:hypothetical protein
VAALIAVVVTAIPTGGFYRAGRYWPPTPTEAEVSAEDLERLEAEPFLRVSEPDGEAKKPNKAAGGKGRATGNAGEGEKPKGNAGAGGQGA